MTTVRTRIADPSGVLVDEPTVVAIMIEEQKMVEFGAAARDMAGRVLEDTIEVAHPLQNGVVADYEITEALLHYLLLRVSGPMRPAPRSCAVPTNPFACWKRRMDSLSSSSNTPSVLPE